MKLVEIYIDGGCSPNPGYGACAAVLKYKTTEKIIVGVEPKSTNNRMEVMAAIIGLSALRERCEVHVYSDSQYLIKTAMGEYGKKANLDLWDMLKRVSWKHKIYWHWVRGHTGIPMHNKAHNAVAQKLGSKK